MNSELMHDNIYNESEYFSNFKINGVDYENRVHMKTGNNLIFKSEKDSSELVSEIIANVNIRYSHCDEKFNLVEEAKDE